MLTVKIWQMAKATSDQKWLKTPLWLKLDYVNVLVQNDLPFLSSLNLNKSVRFNLDSKSVTDGIK